ncbi:MAG: hypothetical protein ABWY23_06775 [Mycetocola sp.]
MSVTLVLLPSPLLGPAAWREVGILLSSRGWPVAGLPRFDGVTSYRDVLATWQRALPPDADYLLVPHSNAGLYVPALGEHRRVVGHVFVDAGLPPATGHVPLAEPAHYGMLARLADEDGILPPWSGWWEAARLTELFPDPETRERVEAEQSRLPLSYFAERMPVPDGWMRRPSGYLAFGDTYARERRIAEEKNWPVRVLPGGHLLMLAEPAAVASALEDLLGAIGFSA